MAKEQSSVKQRERTHLREPRKYKVILHNDDFTTMDFVTFILVDVFQKTYDEAEALMMQVHRKGKAVAGIYSYDIALSKIDKATEQARAHDFPLRLTYEVEEMSKQEEQKITKGFGEAMSEATNMAHEMGHEFILPEHLLAAVLRQSPCRAAMARTGVSQRVLASKLNEYLAPVEASDGGDEAPEFSYQTKQLVTITMQMAQLAQINGLDVPHLIKSIFLLEDSMANYLLSSAVANQADLMAELIDAYESAEYDSSDEVLDEDIINTFGADDESLDMVMDDTDFLGGEIAEPNDWRQFVTCITDNIDHHNPLIGRTSELDRTIQVLCRKEKNNPLHVGEPGVGKTSLVYGLADKIRKGEVPERLKNCRIYQMDMGQMLAGTQFRGDFEKRLKQVMTGAIREGNAIIYLDEMHNIMGAGTTNEGGPDASNILKP